MSIPRWMKNLKNQAILIMALTLVLLVATEPKIGLTWDEPDYIVASEAYTSWFGKLITQPAAALSKEGIDESWSSNHEHPPLDKIWSGIVWSGARFVFNDLTAHRLGNMILVSVMAGLLFLLMAESYGQAAGFAAAAALLTLPRFFFHAHLAALDVPAACAIFFVTFLFWKTKENLSWKWTVLLGLVWGLAFATKINAVFLPPTLFLWALLFRRRWMLFIRIVVMTLIGILFSFAIWPWLYPDFPVRMIDYLEWITAEHWKIGQWYLGTMYMPPPWHFPFVMMWAVVPLTLTALYWVGIFRAGWKWREANSLGGLLFISALVPLLALTTGKSMVYDNDRLFMPAFPFLAALAGMGFGWLVAGVRRTADRMGKPLLVMPATVLAAFLVFLPQSISLVRLYPHLLSYYSETVGGLPGAARLGLETTYWCESYAAAIPYLNEHAKPGDTIWVDPWSHNVMIYYQVHGWLRSDIKIAFPPYAQASLFPEYGPSTFATHAASDFIVVQYRQTTTESTRENPGRESFIPHPDPQWIGAHEPIFQLSYDGVPIMEIYANPAAQASAKEQISGSDTGQPVQNPANMQPFTSAAGNFTVQVPAHLEFAETTRDVDDAGGLRLNILTGVGEGNSIYNIIYFDYPEEWAADPNASQALLHGARNGWLMQIQGTLMEEHAMTLGNYPGLEGIVEASDNNLPVKIKYRHILVRNRCYQISVWIPKDGTFTAEMEEFLQSFAIVEDL
ncbi:MAG: glycosyltransferase family 39 protein [Anaerolineales bacterium]|nr:glycosyltransferase family 39 protein [Anaerolineales bacterium]